MNTILLFVTLVASAIAQSDIDWSQVDPSEIRFMEPVDQQPITKPHRRGTGRITNGTIVTNAQLFPYQVGLLSYNANGAGAWCGASLISNEWILTAAHCVEGKEKIYIYLGTTSRSVGFQYTVGKSNYIIHESYKNLKNDIALIKLPTPVKLSSSVNTISLDNDLTLNKWVNKDAIVSGWGAVASGGTVQSTLQYADVKVLSNEDCKKHWSTLIPSQICQKIINNKGICQGDSGGPLAVTENGKRVLIGLTSFTISHQKQCELDIPRVFTRVSAYRSWICLNTERTVC